MDAKEFKAFVNSIADEYSHQEHTTSELQTAIFGIITAYKDMQPQYPSKYLVMGEDGETCLCKTLQEARTMAESWAKEVYETEITVYELINRGKCHVIEEIVWD